MTWRSSGTGGIEGLVPISVAMTVAMFEAKMTDCSAATMAAFYRGSMAAFMGLDA